MKLIDHRLLVVTGKGGVGRTTTSAALAMAAASAGKRVVVIEMDGLRGLSAAVGLPDRRYAPRALPSGISVMSLTPTECIEDFGRRKLRINALVGLVFRSRVMGAFLDAVPGLHDLVQLGKIEDMLHHPLDGETPFDLVVLDAPATGHGLTLLASARSMAEITRVGPFYELANTIEQLLSNPRETGVVVTTLAEELPVSESVQLVAALNADGCEVRAVVVNQVREPRLPAEPAWPSVRHLFHGDPSPDVRQHAELGDRAWGRQTNQEAALTRLRRDLPTITGQPIPIAELPRIPGARLSTTDIEGLGAHLARQLLGAT